MKELIDFLQAGKLPEESRRAKIILKEQVHYILIHNILVRVSRTSWMKFGPVSLQIAIPREWTEAILEYYHDSPLGGHTGIVKMLSSTLPWVVWKYMPRDVVRYVNTCDVCLRAKKMTKTPKSPMTIREPSLAPFSVLNLNAVGPLPEKARRNKFIQVIVDYFSHFCIAYTST